jgi:hypothetical protein
MQDVRLGAGTPVGAGATESSPPTAGAIQGGVVAANANDHSVTHEVIAESPPDSIARMREEVLAYQDVVRGNKIS